MKTNKKKIQKVIKKTVTIKKKKISATAATTLSTPAKPAPVSIFIAGEAPMVEQYAEVCAAHGYKVYISWNNAPVQKPAFSSDSIIIANTIPANISLAIELTNIDLGAKKKNIERFEQALADTAPILSSSITLTATEQALWISGKHRLVGFAALPTFTQKPLVEIAPTIYSPKETIEVVSRFFQSMGKEIELVQDRIGMVLPRILCRVINEAAFAITDDIASPQDIDTALKLGVNFPIGPIEWAEQIGFRQVYSVLNALHADVQEERYRISPLLKQMAMTRK